MCYLDDTAYTEVENFRPYWNTVHKEHERIAGIAQDLESFRLSLGLPALHRDKVESSSKHQFKEWAKENFWHSSTAAELLLGTVTTGIQYAVFSGHALPEGTGAVALAGLMTLVNTVAIKGLVYLYSED